MRWRAVLADVYPHAAALAFYGPSLGLPTVYSGNRGYWYFGRPSDNKRNALVIGGGATFLREHFTTVRALGEAGHDTPLPNVVLRTPTIWFCRCVREPSSESWPQWRHMNLDRQR